ncbi:MAG: hypothetical protein KBC48_00535 [Candidatus Pacebacteria bacterium]|nr:hypothetical protein [Candidatus Paceibacterota bacterium]
MVLNFFRRSRNLSRPPLEPDEIFIDSHNLPKFDTQQFEGRLEKPIRKQSFILAALVFLLIGVIFGGRVFVLQVWRGTAYAERSENNNLRHTPIFPERGIIYDRNGEQLSWNTPNRTYPTEPGFGHILGYIGYPKEEEIEDGYNPKEFIGREGLERFFNAALAGTKGVKIEEVDVGGNIKSDYLLSEPESGESIVSSVDKRLTAELYKRIETLSRERGFKAGAAVIMDIQTGEVIALTSYPEYNPNYLVATGTDHSLINQYLTDKRSPFLNRAISGLYTPGSIIKPFIALAALEEGVISPTKTIVSTGQLVVPNPYNPDKPTIFKDWKAHGAVDMRRALAVSSDVYFYQIGGGFGKSQAGLGVKRIEEYIRYFGFGAPTGIKLAHEEVGVIPSPEWKKENFDGEDWLLGNTYHTSIGQYGFLVTPIQVVRAVAGLASGKLVEPTLFKADVETKPAVKKLNFNAGNLQVVHEGMRRAVQEGTAVGLNVGTVEIAAKTGTAELGVSKEEVNSWVMGFWPYQQPKYAFAIVMERGHKSNLVGAVSAMRGLLDWLAIYKPEYLKTS